MYNAAKAASGNKQPFIMRRGISGLDDLVDGNLAMGVALAGAKTVYYCDGNAGSDGATGIGGWSNAFKTLAAAIAASHADIALNSLGWAARNVILARGDSFTENLVLMPQKTDIIGCGHFDHNSMASLVGNHVPNATNETHGTRWFNFMFKGDATIGGDIWILGAKCTGMQFIGCKFSAVSETPATAAIVATAAPFLEIRDCLFTGAFSDAVIEFGIGDCRGLRITGCHIEGDEDGIEFASGVTDGTAGLEEIMVVSDNTIITTAICIDDDSDLVYTLRNNCFSGNAKGTTGFGVMDVLLLRSQDNRLTDSSTANMISPALGSL